jgi:hypothetical protein
VAGAAGETIDAAREKFANDIGKKVTSCLRDVRSLGGAAALVKVGLRDLVAIAGADGSNSFASSSGVRPARTNSIICRRNSGA